MPVSFSSPIPNHFFPAGAGEKKQWGNLHDAATAYAITAAAEQRGKTILVICEESQQANELEELVRFFAPKLPVLHFPDWETLPYDRFSPHQDIVSERLRCLFQLTIQPQAVLFVPVTTLMQRIAPTDFVRRNSLLLKKGDLLDMTSLRRKLEEANYRCSDTVFEHGEFAVRGNIIDIFPMGSDEPYRIDLFDHEVEKIRTFDPDTQHTVQVVEAIDILPAREFPFDRDSIRLFQENWYTAFENISLKETHFHRDLDKGIGFPGMEYYLPLFFSGTASLLDYLPADTLLATCGNIENRCRHFWQEIATRYEQYRVDREHPLLPPEKLFLPENELFGEFRKFPRIVLSAEDREEETRGFVTFLGQPASDLSIEAGASRPYAKLSDHLATIAMPILFCAETAGRKEAMEESFRKAGIPLEEVASWQDFLASKTAVAITISPISRGMLLDSLELVAESQLFGNRVQQKRRRKAARDVGDSFVKSLTELQEGAPVVHIDHGIGRYLGLKVIPVDGGKEEFLTLQYADEALLYVPVSSLHLISRYTGIDGEHAPLHRLGNDQWQKTKRKAAEKVRDAAAGLLEIYAKRSARRGFSCRAYSDGYQQFAASFPFEETADQTQAISKVLEDMAAPRPMDRLVCGDVGFGKTEVAMRAAFTAVDNGKQVAILVPTTLLAQQHFETFSDRFANLPYTIELLSRFRTAKEQQQVIERLQAGKVDILIGTHKLLQSNIRFQQLGLVIIDEEHRFGVQQKEAFKALRAEVDVLALTATPIPRTLNLSMAGIRDLSIIATPPAKRLSIKTFVRMRDNNLLREAILRELLRGGQVYYLHNEVETIENTAREIEKLVPEAKVNIGHGQMRERELERVMGDFYHRRFHILVCTTIIETGIDIPTANTIIIDRADKFGLAQLHQLRGRVGRSHHQAYAYLLIPDKKLTRDAEKRLEAIEEATDLGAGFSLATHDLEIRGAGELLGEEQSGQIQTLGFSLYMEMLDRAVKTLQKGEMIDLDDPLPRGTEVNLHFPAIIPDDYIPDVHTRLVCYKAIANCRTTTELDDSRYSMVDRFGPIPPPLLRLYAVTAVKLTAEGLGIEKIDIGSASGKITFSAKTTINPMNLVKLVQSQPALYRLEGASTLRIKSATATFEERTRLIGDILRKLAA